MSGYFLFHNNIGNISSRKDVLVMIVVVIDIRIVSFICVCKEQKKNEDSLGRSIVFNGLSRILFVV